MADRATSDRAISAQVKVGGGGGGVGGWGGLSATSPTSHQLESLIGLGWLRGCVAMFVAAAAVAAA